jgi:hypothetical protein
MRDEHLKALLVVSAVVFAGLTLTFHANRPDYDSRYPIAVLSMLFTMAFRIGQKKHRKYIENKESSPPSLD